MKKCRIIERTLPNGNVRYVIQQKHWILFWKWVDACENSADMYCDCDYNTYEEAVSNLCYFDGSKSVDKILN